MSNIETLRNLVEKIKDLAVGSTCNCTVGDREPDLRHHSEACRYRIEAKERKGEDE